MKISQRDVAAMDDLDNALDSESGYTGARRIVIFSLLMFVVLGVWAWFGVLDEVSTGSGKVIPSSREQVLQSLDGGKDLGSRTYNLTASLASSARLYAEVNDLPLKFPPSLAKWPDLIADETRLYNSRRAQLEDTQRELRAALDLANKELAITQRLVKTGAASHVEVLRLQRQKSDLELKLTDVRSQYYVQAREALSKANAEVDMVSAILKGRQDSVTRLTVKSPVRGIVKNIKVTTIGGVIPPNGELMEIVPVDDHLLIETRLRPSRRCFTTGCLSAPARITWSIRRAGISRLCRG